MPVSMKVMVFWGRPEDGSSRFLWNTGISIKLHGYIPEHIIRIWAYFLPTWYPWSEVRMMCVLSSSPNESSLITRDSTRSSTDNRVSHLCL
jgi:hypothetical protein